MLGQNGSVLHGELTLGAYKVFVFDEFMPSSQPKVSSIHIHVEDADKVEFWSDA